MRTLVLVPFILALFTTPVAAQCCGDCDGNGSVDIGDLVQAVSVALAGCGVERFIDNGGTVTDVLTGLTWERKCRDCVGLHNVAQPYTFTAGPNSMAAWVAQVNAEQFGGHSDWRIPTKEELLSILDRSNPDCGSGQVCIDPVFGATLLPERVGAGVGWYWTSTPLTWTGEVPNGAALAWAVSFSDGGAGYAGQQDTGHVRAVRSGTP